LEDDRDSIGFAALQIGPDEIISPLLFGSLDDRRTPLWRPVLEPVWERIGHLRQHPAGDPQAFPIGIEEADPALGWREGLDQSLQPPPIEAPITEREAIPGVLEKGVQGNLQEEIPAGYSPGRLLA